MALPVVLGAVMVVGGLLTAGWLVWGTRQPKVSLSAGGPPTTDLRVASLRRGVAERAVHPLINRIGARLRDLSPIGWSTSLERRIQRAGSPPGWPLDRAFGAKVVFALTGLLLGVLQLALRPSGLTFVLMLAIAAIGFFIPDAVLAHQGETRQVQIRSALSDTIDQLAITVRAGLSIDAAIARVARTTHGPLAHELSRVVQDVRIGTSRAAALGAMAERVDVPELRQFAAAVAQADELGVPVAQTLQVQAVEMRNRRRQFAEERAMKLPVKILFPMIVCIMPAMFVVLLGPAAIRIYEGLTGM